MSAFALWRRLDTPGHDAALLTENDAGFLLNGTAVFKHPAGPARVDYAVEIDASWRSLRGKVQGLLADRSFGHSIRRTTEGWYLDEALVPGLQHLCDLDYGFTPATNLQQLRRANLAPGEAIDLGVVWFDIDEATLIELPQHYERRDETTYHYASPASQYEALLELSPNGFVRSYPQLWVMET